MRKARSHASRSPSLGRSGCSRSRSSSTIHGASGMGGGRQGRCACAVAERVRGVVTHAMAGLSKDLIQALPNSSLRDHGGRPGDHGSAAARGRGIVVTTTPVLYEDVVDLGVILGPRACRRIVEADRFARAGHGLQGRIPPGHKSASVRASSGRPHRHALAPCLAAYCLRIGHYDPLPKPGRPTKRRLAARAGGGFRHPFLCAAGGPGRGDIITAEVLDALGSRASSSTSCAAGWSTRRRWCGRSARAARCRRPRCIRARAAGAASAAWPRQCPADAAHREQHRRDHRVMGERALDNVRPWSRARGR